ncbi:MAG: hypothetical protein IPQ09_09435 [Myxococcales bacterium]|nr:hypothetical protein [Myxococcales bacterium]
MSSSASVAVTFPIFTAYSGFVPTTFARPPAFPKSHVTPEYTSTSLFTSTLSAYVPSHTTTRPRPAESPFPTVL